MARKSLRAGISTSPTIRKDSYAFVHQEDLNRQALVSKFYVDSSIAALSQDISSTYATQTFVTNSLATKADQSFVTDSLAKLPQEVFVTSDTRTTPTNDANNFHCGFVRCNDQNLNMPTSNNSVWYDVLTVRQSNDPESQLWGYGYQVAIQTTSNINASATFVRTVNGGGTSIWTPWKKFAHDIYSTSATPIGTWSDGKTIYRKTVSGLITTYSEEGTSRAFYASDLATNVSSIVNIGGMYIRNSGHKNPINVPFVSTSGLSITGIPNIYVNSSGTLKLVFFGDSSTTRIEFNIYADYTLAN